MNLMDLFIKIGVDDQASGSINQLTSATVAKGNLMAEAIKKGLSVMVDLGKQTIMTYADFEQLQGGIKKLFGDEAMNAVMKNADNAYKTAGMSANQYLETTTSFAASLIAGLEGDTKKAAELSDMAIKDMSDNANTFGSDISTIQNAYQGFAKQNYTMLDNLRLGYGGTASEMARLINDSGVLGNTVTVTASNINRVSFDKMIEAIHKIQEEMGITGTTEAEAGGTIAGSLNATKSAWDDLMVAMVNDPDSVRGKWSVFAEAFVNSANNILEAIKQIGISLGNLLMSKEDQEAWKRLLDDWGLNKETFDEVSGMFEDAGELAAKKFNDGWKSVKEFFGFYEVGNSVGDAIESILPKEELTMEELLNYYRQNIGGAPIAGVPGAIGSQINITINGAQYSSEEELAEAVARKLGQMVDGKGAVNGYVK